MIVNNCRRCYSSFVLFKVNASRWHWVRTTIKSSSRCSRRLRRWDSRQMQRFNIFLLNLIKYVWRFKFVRFTNRIQKCHRFHPPFFCAQCLESHRRHVRWLDPLRKRIDFQLLNNGILSLISTFLKRILKKGNFEGEKPHIALPLYWPIPLVACDVDSCTHIAAEKTISAYGRLMAFEYYRNGSMTSACAVTADRSVWIQSTKKLIEILFSM